ncbi:MAG TPA: murein L,D-transpeptidase family protein [Kaistiaceae bacterium]|nr:murein L,D-transpeptidase family protein [Kaistiaceae bacterium]
MIHAAFSLTLRTLRTGAVAAGVAATLFLSGCNTDSYAPKHLRPISPETQARMDKMGMRKFDPIIVRIFKKESDLEIWKQTKEGKFALLKTYKICAWSGELGPKVKEGDRQAPEGFYVITPAQMNPNSNYYLSFNLGFPNTFDRAHGRTGKFLMVHGACSSAGCYSMNDEQIQDIYSVARDAFDGGQRDFQVHAFPFRMTPDNLAAFRGNPNMAFWKNLKEGYDHFEVTRQIPKINVCDRRYVFNAELPAGVSRFDPTGKCPQFTVPDAIATAVASKEQKDDQAVRSIVAKMEDRARREAEPSMLANVFGGSKDKPAEGEPAADAAAGETAIANAPIPTPNPSSGAAIAYTGSQAPGAASPSEEAGKSMFSRLFGEEEQKPAASAPAAEAVPAGEAAPTGEAKAEASDGTPMPTPKSSVVATPAEPKSRGVVGRIGGVFGKLTGGSDAPAEDAAAADAPAEPQPKPAAQ